MNRRTWLRVAAGGLTSALAGCGNRSREGPTASPNRTNTQTHRPETEPENRTSAAQTESNRHLSIGEPFTADSGRTVRIGDVSVTKIISVIHGPDSDTYIMGADGQFVAIDIGLAMSSSTQSAKSAGFGLFDGATPNRRAYEVGHPTPEPPLFEPTLVLSVEGERFQSTRSGYWGEDGSEVFDVPAEPTRDGSVVWTDPEEPVYWDLPKTVLEKIPQDPGFKRHSISGRFVEDGIELTFEVENASTRTATYEAHYFAERERQRAGATAQAVHGFKQDVPPESIRTFSELYRYPKLDEVTIVFYDGLDGTRVKIRDGSTTTQ